MHRLHNARSIAIDALTCRKRAFGVSTAVLNDTSDTGTDSNRTQGQHIVDLGKPEDDSRSIKTVTEQGQEDGHGHGQNYMPGKLSRSLRRRRDPSHAKSSHTATEHIDAKTTSSSSNLDSLVREIIQPFKNPLLRDITQRSERPLEGIVCARNSRHVVLGAGTSKRRKKEKHPRAEKAKALGKAKTGGAGTRPVVESARASLAKLDADRAGTLQLLMASRGNNPLPSNDPTLGWGEDVLRPGNDESTIHSLNKMFSKRKTKLDPPPHIHHPPPYTRRVEGLFDDARDLSAPTSTGPNSTNNILEDIDSPSEHKPIAQLAHGLDRVLFNPGVHWLQDPRSRVYNFSPWLESIPKVTDFAFERVTGFIRSSQDEDLHTLAQIHSRPYVGSTSSLTGLLSQIYFLISGNKEVDTSVLSGAFGLEPTNFTPGQRMPVSVVLRYKGGVWAVDSGKDGEDDSDKNVLTWMGTLLEKFLTVPESDFKALMRSSPASAEGEEDKRREAYRYAKSNRFLMRSQLDCVDSRLPGTGVFDVKTRAAVPIRLDLLNFEENSGYLIRTLHGPLESFEKEYYDLIRSAFLKYSFQARIGNMDGVFVAYHNTARIFGFQYVSLEEMDARLFGEEEKSKSTGDADSDGAPTRGTRVFEKCVKLLETVMDEIVGVFGERSVKCTFETREQSSKMNVWVEPLEWDAEKEGKGKNVVELKEAEEVEEQGKNGEEEEGQVKTAENQVKREEEARVAEQGRDGEEEENVKAEESQAKAEEETKLAEQGTDGEQEGNQAETEEPPIVQIDVEVQNFIAGQPVWGPRAIEVAPHENWILHWRISHNSLEASKVRANLASAKSRQFRAWNFPAHISRPEEMRAWWNALDFGGRKNAASLSDEGEEVAEGKSDDVVVGDASPVVMLEEDGLIEEEEEPEADENDAPLFNPKLFRWPSKNINVLRQLSRDGRNETLRAVAEDEAMGREKVVWGLSGIGGVANSGTKEVPGDSSSASTVTQASEMGTVDAVAQFSEEKV